MCSSIFAACARKIPPLLPPPQKKKCKTITLLIYSSFMPLKTPTYAKIIASRIKNSYKSTQCSTPTSHFIVTFSLWKFSRGAPAGGERGPRRGPP